MRMRYRTSHQLSTGGIAHVMRSNPPMRFYEGLLAREGTGGGFLTIAGKAT